MGKNSYLNLTYIENYKNFSQHLIKKGKKATVENSIKKGFAHWIKHIEQKNFDVVLQNAFLYTKPLVGVKPKRKGSKNIYLPLKLTERRSSFLSSKWMLTNAFAKNKRKFYEGVIEELIESSLKKSNSNKKCDELHKLAEESLVNIR